CALSLSLSLLCFRSCLLSYSYCLSSSFLFSFNPPAPTKTYTLSLHDALPIFWSALYSAWMALLAQPVQADTWYLKLLCGLYPLRSEEHTSELQSRRDLVCRLLLEKKNKMPDSNGDWSGGILARHRADCFSTRR